MLRRHVPMLKFSSALDSDPAITEDITLMDTIIRTGTTGRIMATLTIGHIIGMADTDTIATTVIIDIITGIKLTE